MCMRCTAWVQCLWGRLPACAGLLSRPAGPRGLDRPSGAKAPRRLKPAPPRYNQIALTPAKLRILALDLGKKRIGLAISDPLGITAQGLPNLVRTRKRADLEALRDLVRDREVGMILMGNPVNMGGAEGRQSAWVREFAEALERSTGLPIKLWDERLTSVEAGRVLRESGISIAKRAAAVDRLSAVILLQSYLDSL
jgi:putative holliday junction resolvase